jgi:hypothetical protein
VKTRLQVGGKYAQLGIGGTASVIAKEEGVISFWKGIGPAWLREASYTSLRLGLYSPIKVGTRCACCAVAARSERAMSPVATIATTFSTVPSGC